MKTYFRYFISNTGCLEEPDKAYQASGDRRDAGLFIFAVRGTVPAVFLPDDDPWRPGADTGQSDAGCTDIPAEDFRTYDPQDHHE